MTLKKLKSKMRIIHIFFHFTRNNPRNTSKCYYLFVSIIGYDKWNTLIPEVRNAWEMSRNDFDKMYGLVRSYYYGGINFDDKSMFIREFVETEEEKKEKMHEKGLRKIQRETEEIKAEAEKAEAEVKLKAANKELTE